MENTSSNQLYTDRPFIDNIWNNPEELQPYYDFIAKFNELLDKIISNADTKAVNGLKIWKKPHKSSYRTLEGIYLEFIGMAAYRLWTPFGEVKIISSRGSDMSVLSSISNKILDELTTICKIENVTDKIVLKEWVCGIKRDVQNTPSGPFYKLIWSDVPMSNLCEVYGLVFTNIKDIREHDIFRIVSKGKDTF